MLDQLTLGIRLQDESSFKSFISGDNQEALASLKNLVDFSAWNYLYLYGNPGVGKSHLLQACSHYASTKQLSALYLPLDKTFSPLILQDLHGLSVVCIDNIQVFAGDPLWEEALFHCFNRCLQHKTRLVIASSHLPQQLSFCLPDLVSRLASGIIYLIKALTDTQKLMALQLRAYSRGLQLPEEVGQYLLNHFPRDMLVLFQLLDQLDRASLQAQRRLTIPFVKAVLHINPSDSAG